MRIRNQILYKKHDPHKIERLKELGRNYEPPPPPPPPFKSSSLLFSESCSHNNNNKPISNDNYEEQPEPTEGFDNPTMYRTNPDSGFSDLNQIQCNVDNNSPIQRRDHDLCRPNSQASDDSDDSGFRSSRSGQYIHSASNSTGNAQESSGCLGAGVHSLHVQDAVPLFKPIKIHPNEMGRQPIVSYMNRNSSKHRGHRQRAQIPSSQQCSSHSESHNSFSINTANSSHNLVPSSGQINNGEHRFYQPCSRSDINYISKSVNDVHGGQLHSIDSHNGPLTYAGNYGVNSCMDMCNHRNSFLPNGLYNVDSQLSSIGYASDMNSLSDMGSVGFLKNLQNVQSFSLPVTPHMPVHGGIPVNSYIPGYNISDSSHMRPIKPELGVPNISNPYALGLEQPRQLTITEAMVHKPHIEELSDPKLYSVV